MTQETEEQRAAREAAEAAAAMEAQNAAEADANALDTAAHAEGDVIVEPVAETEEQLEARKVAQATASAAGRDDLSVKAAGDQASWAARPDDQAETPAPPAGNTTHVEAGPNAGETGAEYERRLAAANAPAVEAEEPEPEAVAPTAANG